MNDLARKITFLFGTSVILSWVSTTYSVLQITSGDHVNTTFHEFASVCQWFRVLVHLPNKVIVTTRSPQTATYWILARSVPHLCKGAKIYSFFTPDETPQINIAPRTSDESFVPFKTLYLFLETFEPFLLKGWIVCYTAVLGLLVLSRNAPPLKDEFARFFKPCWVYSNLLKMSNVGEFPWSWFLGDRTQV